MRAAMGAGEIPGEYAGAQAGTSAGMRAARVVLLVVGVLTLAWGGYVLLDTQRPDQVVGVLVWIVAAIVVHDGILAPLVLAASVVLRRSGRRLPGVVLAILQGAVVVGVIFTLVVVPEIYAKTLGPANPTVLPGDYAFRLGMLWLVLALLTALLIGLYYLVGRNSLVERNSAARRD
ncbi:hypothetical protein [Planctomonas psychrotolerans]|uniref:hypothetical protein n=1 Tax=Planctomonas psychrotolerans TaxID=2528712 RepID=UPI001D0D2688|nr:hypothetical protein [Planctomonas psychrotolerans]